jgi:hypothetical protein
MHKNFIKLAQLRLEINPEPGGVWTVLDHSFSRPEAHLRLASVEACEKEPYTQREHNLTGRSAVW